MLRPVFPVRNPGWRRLRGRQQRHQPSLDHVLQELVAKFRNGLIGARGRPAVGVVGGDKLLVDIRRGGFCRT
jgi:hypothetical protein